MLFLPLQFLLRTTPPAVTISAPNNPPPYIRRRLQPDDTALCRTRAHASFAAMAMRRGSCLFARVVVTRPFMRIGTACRGSPARSVTELTVGFAASVTISPRTPKATKKRKHLLPRAGEQGRGRGGGAVGRGYRVRVGWEWGGRRRRRLRRLRPGGGRGSGSVLPRTVLRSTS